MTRQLRVYSSVAADLFEAFSDYETEAPEQVDRLHRLRSAVYLHAT